MFVKAETGVPIYLPVTRYDSQNPPSDASSITKKRMGRE